MARKVHRRKLDKLLEKTEREIKAIMESWERSFVDEKEDSSPEIPSIGRRHLGHPLDLNDECLREDPNYNEKQVEQEALQDYLQELEEQRAHPVIKQAGRQKGDAAPFGSKEDKSPALPGKLTICAKALASMSQGRPPTRKKPCVIPSIAGEAEEESGSTSSSSEEEEAAILLRKMPKRNLQSRSLGTGKTHTDQSSEKSETSPSSSGERHHLKPYNFRRQSKQVSYVSHQEEEEKGSSSGGNSEEDWVPEEGESEAEEEEDAQEMEVEEEGAEREEESESDPGPPQAEPQWQNHPKTVRSYRCSECNREFSNSSNMWKHLRIHRGELPFGCHVCGKSYADPSNLTKHQMKHLGERPHQCTTCPKAFYVKNHLDAHMRRHRGIRPFACLECRRSFCSRAELVAHVTIHVQGKGRQPLMHCKDCDKTFAGRKLFRKHLKRHKNLVCEVCGEVCAFKRKYNFHKRLHASARWGGYAGRPLHQGPAQNAEHSECATSESSASVPLGLVAKQPVGTAAHTGSQKQPVGSTQAATRSFGSVSTSSQLSADGQARPSDLASTVSLKEPSHLAQTDAGTSQRNGSLTPATYLVLDHGRAKSSTLVQTPLQLKPAGNLLQDVPVVRPVTSSPAIANSFAHTPALPGPPGLVIPLPHSQASVAFPGSAASSAMIVPVVILGLWNTAYRS